MANTTKSSNQANNQSNQSNDAIKDPDEWVTGDEQMTGPQRSYLQTLAREAGESVDENMSKAEASKRIDELQAKTGRGADNDDAK